mmetsp:Transcript_3300/g.10575  ORF Transcript_3300/g.10575 Transcript_3300/m.10575 type:complete len:212 (-) Transcript_3300:557-1192(-)
MDGPDYTESHSDGTQHPKTPDDGELTVPTGAMARSGARCRRVINDLAELLDLLHSKAEGEDQAKPARKVAVACYLESVGPIESEYDGGRGPQAHEHKRDELGQRVRHPLSVAPKVEAAAAVVECEEEEDADQRDDADGQAILALVKVEHVVNGRGDDQDNGRHDEPKQGALRARPAGQAAEGATGGVGEVARRRKGAGPKRKVPVAGDEEW